jgi:hypothetical protein
MSGAGLLKQAAGLRFQRTIQLQECPSLQLDFLRQSRYGSPQRIGIAAAVRFRLPGARDGGENLGVDSGGRRFIGACGIE